MQTYVQSHDQLHTYYIMCIILLRNNFWYHYKIMHTFKIFSSIMHHKNTNIYYTYASGFTLAHPILQLQCNVVSVIMIKTTTQQYCSTHLLTP